MSVKCQFKRIALQRGCINKRYYPSKGAAEAALRSLKRREIDEGMLVYRCPYFDHWHIGHPKQKGILGAR